MPTLTSLNLGMLLTALDFNIVATAVPIISSEFSEYRNSAWLGTGFLVSFALVLPVYAKLGDIFGRRNMFVFATIIFILGSGLCGGSTSMDMLIWSRVIQGIGGGGIYGLVNVIITDLVPLRDVGKYLSFTAAIWAVADVLGPLLGGIFSQYATWRWCFYINLCISPISLVITLIVLKLPAPKVSYMEKVKTYDYLGTLTLVGGTASVLLAISWGGNTFPWSDAKVIGCLVGGLVCVAVFAVVQWFVPDPLLHPTLLKNRTVLTIFAAEFFYGANLLGMMYYVPQFFQLVFGDSAVISGVGLLPMMLGLAVGNPLAAWITSKWGISVWNAIIGAALEVLVSGLMTRWNSDTSRAEAVVELIFLGAGQGAVMSGLLLSSQVAVEPISIGVVTGLVIFMQTIGDIFGIAFFAAVYVNELTSLLGRLSLSSDQVSSILADVQLINSEEFAPVRDNIVQVYSDSMGNGWWLMFACAAACLFFTCFAKQHKFV
jgi:Major Facilitator Superfamily